MSASLRIAEFVLPGHPDKLCDAIADALVQEAGRRERRALVGVEVAHTPIVCLCDGSDRLPRCRVDRRAWHRPLRVRQRRLRAELAARPALT